MSSRVVTVDQLAYNFASAPPPPVGARTQAIILGRAIDELTGQPATTRLRIRHHPNRYFGRSAAGGVFGLAGQPTTVLPDLAVNPSTVSFTLHADGYLRREFTVPIPVTLGFPDVFQAVDIGEVDLHRPGVTIQGYTRQVTAGGLSPVANATVQITEIWPQAPGPGAPPGGDPANLVALTAGLYAARDPAIDHLRRRDMTLVNIDAKTLLEPAVVGARQLHLSNRINLPAAGIVAIDTADTDRIEYLPFNTVTGATTADQPAVIDLVHPCRREHAVGVDVVPAVPQAPGPDRNLTRPGIPGDVPVFLDSLAGLGLAAAVELHGGAPAEFHPLHLYEVTSDANGFFRLPVVSRLAQLRLTATHPAILTPAEAVMSPDYRMSSTGIDLVFA